MDNIKDTKYKIAVIGPEGVISGFKALGAVPMRAQDPEEALCHLKKICSEDMPYAVVIIMEDLMRLIPEDEYKNITKYVLPAIVALPGPKGGAGYGQDKLKTIAEKAIGASII